MENDLKISLNTEQPNARANFSISIGLKVTRPGPLEAKNLIYKDEHPLNFTMLHDCLAGKQILDEQHGILSINDKTCKEEPTKKAYMLFKQAYFPNLLLG